ncbi:flagellar biosynthetic protein FliR [Arhodomonas aquaeolei]|uniref:flagellar biosynthetic protein FliR n=1 Tax=Arhodomonas TaxID=2368 RepID=UPI0003632A92|nr:flagellar biosynthetic protein FliR [Arhodomonas aquaeolei]MCS4502785.1 flagellar biosynthetic protein FliR [Arhodomonas aquaeolei]
MNLEAAQITAWLGQFLWPLVRVGAMMLVAPVFSNAAVPVRIRVLLGVALTVAVMPAAGGAPALDPLSAAAVVLAAQQVIIGAAMGLLVAMAFQTVVVAGESISLTMGLGFATMVDPQSGVPVPVLSQFLLVILTLLFLAFGGHLVLIQLVAESFRLLPLDAGGLAAEDFHTVVAFASTMFSGAVLLALPAMAALLMINMIIGVMTRVAPQMNIFSVGFPITMLSGFVILLTLVLPSMPQRMSAIWRQAFDTIRQILGA